MRYLRPLAATALILPALVLAGHGAAQYLPAENMPETASEYARMVESELGVVPTVDCGVGVRVPIHVDGVEVFEDQSALPATTPTFVAAATSAHGSTGSQAETALVSRYPTLCGCTSAVRPESSSTNAASSRCR